MKSQYELARNEASTEYVQGPECVVADDYMSHEDSFKAGSDFGRDFEKKRSEGLVKAIKASFKKYKLTPAEYPEDDHDNRRECMDEIKVALKEYEASNESNA